MIRPSLYRKTFAALLRGRGECRVPSAPAAARVVVVNTRVSHHGYTGSPGIPARDGVNGFLRALPGDRALLSPSSVDRSTNLTPASRRQNHTTSPSAFAPFVKGASASTASRPASVTIAIRPSVGRDGEIYTIDSGQPKSIFSEIQKYFPSAIRAPFCHGSPQTVHRRNRIC